MKVPCAWGAGTLLVLLHIALAPLVCLAEAAHHEEKRRGAEEADDDAIFAAAVLGLVHDRVRDVGNVFRAVGDTTGALAGGSMKAVGATVNGVSAVLEAASRTVGPRAETASQQTSQAHSGDVDRGFEGGHAENHGSPMANGGDVATSPREPDSDGGDRAQGSAETRIGNNPDPFDRIESVVRVSLAGSLKLVSAAVRGVGDAVFQAGTVAEELTGGTGQVAEDMVRVVQGAVGAARDDMLQFSGHDENDEGDVETCPTQEETLVTARPVEAEAVEICPASPLMRASRFWRGIRAFARALAAAVVKEAVALFRRRNGAPPPAPRFAVLILLVILVWKRRRRRLPTRVLPVQGLPSETSQGDSAGESQLPPPSAAPAPAPAPAAAGRFSPSWLLSANARPVPTPPSTPRAASLPSRRRYDLRDDVDPLLPSPAQARSAQVRLEESAERLVRRGRENRMGNGATNVSAAVESVPGDASGDTSKRRGRWYWRWHCGARRRGNQERRAGMSRLYQWLLLLLLWFAASMLEERERDKIAWLAWDEGFRQGQVIRAVDSVSESESAGWLNYLISSMWGGEGSAPFDRRRGVVPGENGLTGIGALDGLSSFVSEHLAQSILEALDELKQSSVVGVELEEVDLGSSSPQILGVKILDTGSPASPGWGDGRCDLVGECFALKVDLEVATQGLRLGFRVKASASREKALLPRGTIRILEFYFRGSVSVRVDLRKEFPFVGMALVAFDGAPDVQVRLEQWGLDAITLGAVDEWARLGLQQALKPYVLPGYLEIDAAEAVCPDCPSNSAAQAPTAQTSQPFNSLRLPSSRLPAAAAAAAAGATDDALESKSKSKAAVPKTFGSDKKSTDVRRLRRTASKARNLLKSATGRSRRTSSPAKVATSLEHPNAGQMEEPTALSAETVAPAHDRHAGDEQKAEDGGTAVASPAESTAKKPTAGVKGTLHRIKKYLADGVDERNGPRSPMDWAGMD